jgi:hypothetical protein
MLVCVTFQDTVVCRLRFVVYVTFYFLLCSLAILSGKKIALKRRHQSIGSMPSMVTLLQKEAPVITPHAHTRAHTHATHNIILIYATLNVQSRLFKICFVDYILSPLAPFTNIRTYTSTRIVFFFFF